MKKQKFKGETFMDEPNNNNNTNGEEINTTSGLTAITQLVDITANELFTHNETTSRTHKVFIYSAPNLKEQQYQIYEEDDDIKCLEEAQKDKMRELWDNEYDEEWETLA